MKLQAPTLLSKSDIFFQLDKIKKIGSFDKAFYPVIDNLVASVYSLKREGEINDEDLKEIRNFFGTDFLENTLHGMALIKKYGYAGDFLMIDKIYTGNSTDDPFFSSWDNYFQDHAAPKAVRNRKEYFKRIMLRKANEKDSINLLNVASGPCRDLLELYDANQSKCEIKTTCIEMDSHAIEYAKNIVVNYQHKIDFVNKNIFKFDTEIKYDMIWSAGLFDYFNNKSFVYVLNKFKNWIKPGGEIIVGNFNRNHNPTREYMELFGDWHLYHRTENELTALAKKAGFNENEISIGKEEEKVNLFLHIIKE